MRKQILAYIDNHLPSYLCRYRKRYTTRTVLSVLSYRTQVTQKIRTSKLRANVSNCKQRVFR